MPCNFNRISAPRGPTSPAHTSVADVGRLHLGDGSLLTERDRRGNARADVEAKAAVSAHRVPENIRKIAEAESDRARGAAMWLGRVTHLANEQPSAPHRDSEASRRSALASGRRGSAPGRAAAGARADVGPRGGRDMVDAAVAAGSARWASLLARVRAREAAAAAAGLHGQ